MTEQKFESQARANRSTLLRSFSFWFFSSFSLRYFFPFYFFGLRLLVLPLLSVSIFLCFA